MDNLNNVNRLQSLIPVFIYNKIPMFKRRLHLVLLLVLFNIADVGVAQDTRIQNLTARTDTVISGTSAAQSFANLQLFNDDFVVTDSSMNILAQSFADRLSGILPSFSEVLMNTNNPEVVLNSNSLDMMGTNFL